jgi:CHAT domain-containing protein
VSDATIDYARIAWLFAAADRHGEGVRYLQAAGNDAGFILAAELFADAGSWTDALWQYARIDDVYGGSFPLAASRLAIGRAWIGDLGPAQQAAERAIKLAAQPASVSDPFLRVEAESAAAIVSGTIDRSTDAVQLRATLEDARVMEGEYPWRVSIVYQTLADFYRERGRSETADELQLRSWSLRAAETSAPDFSIMEALASRFRGSRGENDVWENRHFTRTASILNDQGASKKVQALALERFLTLCARHDAVRMDSADLRERIEWVTQSGRSFVERGFQGDHRVFNALVHVASRRWGRALTIMRQRLVYENGPIIEAIAGRPLELNIKAIALFDATPSLVLAILAMASECDPADLRYAFGALSARRQLAQHAETLKYKHWRTHVTTETQETLNDWIQLRRRIKEQAFHHLIGPRGPVQMLGLERMASEALTGTPKRYRRALLSAGIFVAKAANNRKLFKEKFEAEDKLRTIMPPIQIREDIACIDITELQNRLLPDEVFVEYVRASVPKCPLITHETDQEPNDIYYAFACRSDSPIALIEIASTIAVDDAVKRFRRSLGVETPLDAPIKWFNQNQTEASEMPQDEEQDLGDASQNLFKLLLTPILQLMPGRSLTVVPDGAICQVPFQALRTDDSELVIDRYNVRYINSARDLLAESEPGTPCSVPVVVAAPDFNLSTEETRGQSESSSEERHGAGSGSLLFRALPGSAVEGAEIAALLGAKSIVGAEATVEAVSSLISPEILHIASHGFFFPPPSAPKPITKDGEADDPTSGFLTGFEDPFMRSGIALAGANAWLYGRPLPASARTGFLTAQEVSTLDLTGTTLVTMSACDSGLGDVSIGQGIMGLRQSLAVAGAKWTVVSLWPVPDQATAWLMKSFYTAWDRNSPPDSALREAQIATRKVFGDLRSWAGFICVGVPRSQAGLSAHSGIEALLWLASVSFEALLDEAHMRIKAPEGFKPRVEAVSSASLYRHALVADYARIEIRYSVIPFAGPHRARFTETDYQTLLRRISDGQTVSPSPFPREGVRAEFGAHAGFTASVTEPRHLDGYSFAAIVYVVNELFGAALIWYLFDRMEDVLPVMNREFNSLRFQGELV